VVNNGTRFIA